MRRSFVLAVHLDDHALRPATRIDAAVLDGDADPLGLGVGSLLQSLTQGEKISCGSAACCCCCWAAAARPAAAVVACCCVLLGLRFRRGLPLRLRAAAGLCGQHACCNPSLVVIASAAQILRAARADADMIRYFIRCSLFPPAFGAGRPAAPALVRRPKKGGSVTPWRPD